MKLKLNWLGVYVSDFAASLHFYTETLGISASDSRADWAFFETTGMTLELFGGAAPPAPGRLWGQGQTIRPAIQVNDWLASVADLRQKGVVFSGESGFVDGRQQIELLAPDGLRWSLTHDPAHPIASDPSKTHIGWVEMKVQNLAGQTKFYSDLLGLRAEEGSDGRLYLRQRPGEAFLLLEEGGDRATPLRIQDNSLIAPPPHLLSFETDDIQTIAQRLKERGVTPLIDVVRRAWGGIEMILADVDGNPVQLVEYVQ